LKVQVAPAFDEIDFGDWTGRSFDSLHPDPAWRDWNTHRAIGCPPGGEPFEQVRRRAMEGLEQLVRQHPDRTVLVASHADVIKAVIASVLQMSLDLLERFDIARRPTPAKAGE
jgi:broad specificity phosphatase PhoE